jgi:lipopolysaccharide transport system ATP-binding protein
MSDVVIRVESLSKRYRIGPQERYKALRDVLTEVIYVPARAIASVIRRRPSAADHPASSDSIWALRNVSFEIAQGELLGIVGRNGAGQTTLLKILSRITEPTAGHARIWGRVGSLMEVGTGFHPELTGRENIYLSGAILGMTRREIGLKFNEIVAFAEIDKFLDTPVKHYSSGMYVRLPFAVAAHLRQEILLVDEVLAVGDALFQRKCIGKMGEVAKEGRTVVFVSHNMTAVQSLCTRAIWLHDGEIRADGSAEAVVSSYLRTVVSGQTERVWVDRETAPGNDTVRLHRARVRPENGSPSDQITVHTPFVIEFEYWNLRPDVYLNLNVPLYNEREIPVFSSLSIHEPVWHGRPFPVGLFRSVCHVPGDLLNDGAHRVGLQFVQNEGVSIYSHDNVLVFDVQDSFGSDRGAWHGKLAGVVRPRLRWSTELINTD